LSERIDEVVDRAKRDPEIAKMLSEIAKLDAQLMPKGVPLRLQDEWIRTRSAQWQQQVLKASRLCEEVALKIVGPGEDLEEMAMCISFNCQNVVRQLDKK
jgi:hypothetical protein